MESAFSSSDIFIPTGMNIATVKGSNDYSFESDGEIVDFKNILQPYELEIADEMRNSIDSCQSAVSRAYELFNGNLDKFLQSDLFNLLKHQRISKALGTYDSKLLTHGLTAKELNGLPLKKLTEQFSGQEQRIEILQKFRATMQKQLQRSSNELISFLKNLWVSAFSLVY